MYRETDGDSQVPACLNPNDQSTKNPTDLFQFTTWNLSDLFGVPSLEVAETLEVADTLR